MRALMVAGVLLVFQSIAFACSPSEWGQTQNDLSWALERDATAKDCVRINVTAGDKYFDAIIRCNRGADEDRMRRCGAEACNWLKARHKNPAC